MKYLYNTLTQVLRDFGYDVASWGLDEIQPEERTVKLELVEQNQIEPQFDMYEASFNIVFLNGDWAENASKLSDALTTFLPMEDRVDEASKKLLDNSSKLTLLEAPQFSEISVEYNEDTAEEEHAVMVTIHYC
jgi:hypothetical protein